MKRRTLTVLLTCLGLISACGGAPLPSQLAASPSAVTNSIPTQSATDPPSFKPSPASTKPPALHLLALGNSIVPEPLGFGYPERLAKLIHTNGGPLVEVDDRGGGGTSESLLHDIKTDPTLRQRIADADIVTITIGGNDSDPAGNYPDRVCDSVQAPLDCLAVYQPTFQANIDSILSEINSLADGHAQAVRVTSPDYNPFIGWSGAPSPTMGVDFYRYAARGLTAGACLAAEEHGAKCADFLLAFNGPDGTGDAAPYLQNDHLHPSAVGADLIAQIIFDLGFEELGLDTGSPVP